MKSNKYKLLHAIFFLMLTSIISGVIKVEYMLGFLNEILVNQARIMSYITLFIGSIFFYFILIVSIYISFIIIAFVKLDVKFNVENFYQSIIYFIYSLFINEIIKMYITIIVFKPKSTISNIEDFNFTIKENVFWADLLLYSDLFFISSGCFLFSYTLTRIELNIKFAEAVLSVIPLFISFFIFRNFYS